MEEKLKPEINPREKVLLGYSEGIEIVRAVKLIVGLVNNDNHQPEHHGS